MAGCSIWGCKFQVASFEFQVPETICNMKLETRNFKLSRPKSRHNLCIHHIHIHLIEGASP